MLVFVAQQSQKEQCKCYCHITLSILDVDECNSGPCQNGQTCVNGLNQYLCMCTGSFTGVNCERRKLICLFKL